jgi:hypothetical protein
MFRGKALSDEQYQQLKEGKTIYITDFKNKEGNEYNGYITYHKESGKTAFSFRNPDKPKEKQQPDKTAPDSKKQTQQQENLTPPPAKSRGRRM